MCVHLVSALSICTALCDLTRLVDYTTLSTNITPFQGQQRLPGVHVGAQLILPVAVSTVPTST